MKREIVSADSARILGGVLLCALLFCALSLSLLGCSSGSTQKQAPSETASSTQSWIADFGAKLCKKLVDAGWSEDQVGFEYQETYNIWINDDVFNDSNEWADGLFKDCYNKLVTAGSIEVPQPDGPNKWFVFKDTHDIKFVDEEVGARLLSDLEIPLDNVIEGEAGGCVYINSIATDEALEYPLYYPLVKASSGTYSYHSTDLKSVREDPVAGKFAESLDDCKYLLAWGGYVSSENKGFYNETGGATRQVMTTVVFVMDAKTREFVHIRSVDTDIPANETFNPSGEVNPGAAKRYMHELLTK